MKIQERVPLSQHTTLRTGGPARYFVEAVSLEEVREAVRLAQRHGLPTRLLGSGSNVLASDAGFDGVVIKMATRGIQETASGNSTVVVTAEAGESWDALVEFAVARGLGGLEAMSLIPGTVGAAVIGNIGAYGAEVKDTLQWAEAMDLRSGRNCQFAADECRFSYRWSHFKTAEGRGFVITRAAFALRRDAAPNLRYKDVREKLAASGVAEPTIRDVREAVISIRQGKLPDLARIGTAGSFFKNPVLPRDRYEALAIRFPGLPGFDEGNGLRKVPLGWILDKVCGMKGLQRGRVGTHPDQALVIVNDGGTATEVEALAYEIATAVKETTGITIEWEVEHL
ncbi:MAG: UDP-N-acetylmuramate dehydrogenase [Verrucomicrobia bacterium]|nr:UDP-N-acetylmuramate dehydrogenase [Verrucomicrobiota bacterium]